MVCEMARDLALATLRRDIKAAVPPLPGRTFQDEATYFREIAEWATQISPAGPQEGAAAKRVAEAVHELEVIADIQTLIASAPDPRSKSATANAVLHGVRLGGIKLRDPTRRPKKTIRHSQEVLERIAALIENGRSGHGAAKLVLGDLPRVHDKKAAYDYAASLARRLIKSR